MKAKLFLSSVLVLLAISAIAQPEDPALRREVERFYMEMDKLASRGDCDAILATLHPNYVYTDAQGKRMDKAEVRVWLESMKANSRTDKVVTRVRNVRGNDDEVVAWVEMKTTFRMRQGNRWVPMTRTYRFAETHRRTPNGGWVTMMTQELPVDEKWSFKTGGG